MKELLDTASWLSRHPRFRSLLRMLPGGGWVQICGTGPHLLRVIDRTGIGWVSRWIVEGFTNGWRPQSIEGELLVSAATHELAKRAAQLRRRYPDE